MNHSSCTRNDDHVSLLIITGSNQIERIMSQAIISAFKAVGGEGGET